jgi:hypothetical protein
MDLLNLERRLAEFEIQYNEWKRPIEEVMNEKLPLVDAKESYTHRDYTKDYDEAKERQRALYNPIDDISTLVAQVCRDFSTLDSQQRGQIRASARRNKFFREFLLGHIGWSAKQLKATKNPDWLNQGLLAASIEDCITDFRDTFVSLAKLYLAAEDVGIDPMPHFQAVSQLSNDEPRTGSGSSSKKILSVFHTLPILEEERSCRR